MGTPATTSSSDPFAQTQQSQISQSSHTAPVPHFGSRPSHALRCAVAHVSVCAVLLSDVLLLDRAVALKDGRLTARVLRDVNRVRRFIHPSTARQSTGTATSAAATPRSMSSSAGSTTTATPAAVSASPLPHLAALFAVIQSLHASTSPPLSLSHISHTLLAKDDTAQHAWTEAQQRSEQQRQKEETERKEKADSESAQQLLGPSSSAAAQGHDDMQLDDDGKQQHHQTANHQPHSTAQQSHGQPFTYCCAFMTDRQTTIGACVMSCCACPASSLYSTNIVAVAITASVTVAVC